jgi:hypothetical protein
MADWVTISSLATAGGTLVLAIATFSSVRSANRSARVAEQSLLIGMRPVLVPSREEDPIERLRFGDGTYVTVPGHGAAIVNRDGRIYLAMALRNGGTGLAVILGWRARTRTGEEARSGQTITVRDTGLAAPSLDDFHRQQLDLYVPAGDTGYWLGGLYEADAAGYDEIRQGLLEDDVLWVDLLYGDHQGGQRTVARFGVSAWSGPAQGDEPDAARTADGQRAFVLRYWNVDDRNW